MNKCRKIHEITISTNTLKTMWFSVCRTERVVGWLVWGSMWGGIFNLHHTVGEKHLKKKKRTNTVKLNTACTSCSSKYKGMHPPWSWKVIYDNLKVAIVCFPSTPSQKKSIFMICYDECIKQSPNGMFNSTSPCITINQGLQCIPINKRC